MSSLDWEMENRAAIGHGVIDIAPGCDAVACYSGWYAWRLGLDDIHGSYEVNHWLRPLLDKMATAGVLVKTGGQYDCEECGRTHQEPVYFRLAVDRAEARELWDEHTREPRWWALTPRAKSAGTAFSRPASLGTS